MILYLLVIKIVMYEKFEIDLSHQLLQLLGDMKLLPQSVWSQR